MAPVQTSATPPAMIEAMARRLKVDGLHLRAGSSPERTFQIHGNVFFMRCAAECTPAVCPLPSQVPVKGPYDRLTDAEAALLVCPRCGGMTRFDSATEIRSFNYIPANDITVRSFVPGLKASAFYLFS